MTYQETIDYLYHQLPLFERVGGSAYKAGLDTSIRMDDFLGNPHRNYKTIHVAGTNGKGSTSHMLAAVLQAAGYKTGLYTSPHLKDFRERIRVNGAMIPQQKVIDFVQTYAATFEPLHPSFFELTMEMAFEYFATEHVDIAVIEVGLGGRLDSTNIIMPVLSVITNISFDHQQFLGNTLEQIAAEKAGIMKTHIPVIIGEAAGSVKEVFEAHARQTDSPLYFAEGMICLQHGENPDVFYNPGYGSIAMGLKGLYQEKNLATVLSAVTLLRQQGIVLPPNVVKQGIGQVVELTGLQGRWQVLQDHPLIICDTGHNEAGIRYVMQQLVKLSYRQLHIVFGMVSDKDHHKVLPLLPQEAIYYFTQAAIPRALDAHQLQQQAASLNLQGMAYPSVAGAVLAAKQAATTDDVIFIGGSSYVVAEVL